MKFEKNGIPMVRIYNIEGSKCFKNRRNFGLKAKNAYCMSSAMSAFLMTALRSVMVVFVFLYGLACRMENAMRADLLS